MKKVANIGEKIGNRQKDENSKKKKKSKENLETKTSVIEMKNSFDDLISILD